ncbi:hypothetical protein G6F46_015565 [Rhizopus delemar]|nr:hypothetical protein G6F46_015565 [Rhizopus delemar]
MLGAVASQREGMPSNSNAMSPAYMGPTCAVATTTPRPAASSGAQTRSPVSRSPDTCMASSTLSSRHSSQSNRRWSTR